MTGRPPPYPPPPRPAEVVPRLVAAGIPSRIGKGDTSLWPNAARPGWVGAARAARPLVGEIEGLRDQLRLAGQVRVVLAAAGGVGVAAEALCAADPRLVVLDSTDPVQVADALAGELAATVLVVSAPPGEDTTGVELVRDAVHRAFRAEGLDPDAQTVVVTPPGGPLQQEAGGAVVVLGPADVDGPWAALTAFALVPAGLAGADVGAVLADAAAAAPGFAADSDDNPALELGALLAGAPVVALADDGTPALAEWAGQLVAGGLGKDGHGPLVVPVEGPDAPEWAGGAALALSIGDVPGAAGGTAGSPATQILLWQHAVAVAAHLLGVDPTDRPDAAAARPASGGEQPAFVEGGIEVHAGPWLPAGTDTVAGALRALVGSVGTHLTVHAYLDRVDDASAAVLRPELARRTGLPTVFGWAPRWLPGSGQRDKGGPVGALVCQLTGAADDTDADPGADPGTGTDPLAEHQIAQARGDAVALATRGTIVLRLHFTDRVAGLVTLARAVQQL
ncbi:glucose-6-phosphate isomerase [Pseudonocardia aurantiaca]|uniref:Glucose-6-phosphate isomerase n=1 Tax=Pseudonocardia aurantiaca TaxID=75290 RepID=A0ABW4FGR3_9PSEU